MEASTAPVAGSEKLERDVLAEEWGGGRSPFGLSWQKLMMWMFLASDALLFAGFLASYGFIRLATGSWPDRGEVFNMGYIGLMTFILITSSATMASAVGAAQRHDLKKARMWVLLTTVGGLIFLGFQANEWAGVIQEGARLTSNPWGAPAFAAFFFMVTGFHGLHVLIGVILLVTVTLRLGMGKTSEEGVELAGLYWHFVDLVWVFIFTFFYLL